MMRRGMLRASRLGLVAAFLTVVLSACSIGSRAEALYFFQHRVLAALTSTITAVEPDHPDLADRLYDREDELYSACRALWEAGERRIKGLEIEDELRWQVFVVLDSCAEKVSEIEALVWRVNASTAEIYLDGL
jgi:hypothetical protein